MNRILSVVGASCVGLFAIIAFTQLSSYLCRSGSTTSQIGPADAIVVLGAGLYADGRLSSSSLQRALHGMMLFKKQLSPLLVLLGTEDASGGASEAETRGRLALAFGISPDAIVAEAGAWTTRAEAAQVRMLLHPRHTRRILLVTSSLHMLRARYVFQREGFNVLAAPVDDCGRSLDLPEDRLRLAGAVVLESLGRIYYRLADSL